MPSRHLPDLQEDHLERLRPAIDQVKASVPDNQWCTCQDSAADKKPGIFAGLFGR